MFRAKFKCRWIIRKVLLMKMLPPTQPDESDCCNSGCNPCILDMYQQQLEKYNRQLENNSTQEEGSENCLSLTSYSVFKLISKKQHTYNTYFLIFEFVKFSKEEVPGKDSSGYCIRYKPGQHFLLKGNHPSDENVHFTRAYTPIDGNKTTFTVLVRIYEVGQMSQYLKSLKVGQETLWRGPYGDYRIDYRRKYLLIIAQGTGIAPVYSVIREILKCEECETRLQVFFCCKNVADILLRDRLYNFQAYWNFKCDIFLTDRTEDDRSKYRESLKYERLSKVHLTEYFGTRDKSDAFVLICGSETFNKEFQKDIIELGIVEGNVHLF